MGFIFGLGFFQDKSTLGNFHIYSPASLPEFFSSLRAPVVLSITTHCIKDMQQSIIGKP